MREGLFECVAAASGAETVAPKPAGRVLAPLADIPDGQCRDGPPELVVGRKHPRVPMPMPPRRRHEIREPVKKLKPREFDDAIGSWPRGLSRAARADPVGGLVSGEHVADFGCAAAWPVLAETTRAAARFIWPLFLPGVLDPRDLE